MVFVTTGGEASACMRNLVISGRHNLKKTDPETTYKNPVLPDKLQQTDMKLCAKETCLKPNIRGTLAPARRAHPCRAAHAQGSVLLLWGLALGEFFQNEVPI